VPAPDRSRGEQLIRRRTEQRQVDRIPAVDARDDEIGAILCGNAQDLHVALKAHPDFEHGD
jgi:hypothetical protein